MASALALPDTAYTQYLAVFIGVESMRRGGRRNPMTDDKHLPETLKDGARNDKIIWYALAIHGPMTRRELAEETGIHQRNLPRSFHRLSNHDLLMANTHPRDGRKLRYRAVSEE